MANAQDTHSGVAEGSPVRGRLRYGGPVTGAAVYPDRQPAIPDGFTMEGRSFPAAGRADQTMRDDTGNDVVACDHCGEYMARRRLRESHWAGEGACAEAQRAAEARFRSAMEERRRRKAEARRR